MSTTNDVLYHMGGVPVHGEFTTGDVYFVHSVRANKTGNNGKHPNKAFATLDEATNACTANHNDIVYIMPNHTEELAATTWVPDVAGVQYIGVGTGADAPALNFPATTSIVTVTGGNNVFRNIHFYASTASVVTALDCDTVNHVRVDNCVFDYGSTSGDGFLIAIDIDGSDHITVENCRFTEETAGGIAAKAIRLATCDHVHIKNNTITGDYSSAAILGETGAGVGLMIMDNMIYNDDTAAGSNGIDLNVAFTGMIARNMISSLFATGGDAIIDPGSCQMFENYIATLVNTYGAATLVGAAST
jgi:hypothetical protein